MFLSRPVKTRLPTCTKVSEVMVEVGMISAPFTSRDVRSGNVSRSVCDETYGSASFLYISCPTPETRVTFMKALKAKGFKCKARQDDRSVEVQVSYFKGWHWDE
jgi:hypothetical protein